LGRGRWLIAIGSVIAMMGMPLPWFTVGGVVLPAFSENGFQGAGVLVFLASVGMLAIIVLPYTTKSGDSSIERPATYAGLLFLGLAGLFIEIVGSWNEGRLGGPERALGLWLGAVGMAVAAWGVAELIAESRAEG
jgi:hypothetical protein